MKAWTGAVAISGLVSLCSGGSASSQPNPAPGPQLVYAVQGWTAADRDEFYTTSQGSHVGAAAATGEIDA